MKLKQNKEKDNTRTMNSKQQQNDHVDHDIEDAKSMITTIDNHNTKSNVWIQKDSPMITGGTGFLLRYVVIGLWIILTTIIGTGTIYQSIMKKGVDGTKTVRKESVLVFVFVCFVCMDL